MGRLALVFGISCAWSLCAACDGAGDGPPPEGDSDTDTDGDVDSDTDADDDADVDMVNCGPAAGMERVGASWTWAYDDGVRSGTAHEAVTSIDHQTKTVGTEWYAALASADANLTVTTTTLYLCDWQGLQLLSQRTEAEVVESGTSRSGWTELTCDPPATVLPGDLYLGVTWTNACDGTITTQDGGPSAYSRVVENVAVRQEEVEVPAGSFHTLRVESSGDVTGWSNVVDHVGRVRSDTEVLLENTQ